MFVSTAYAASEEAGATGVFPPFDPSTFSSQLFWLALTFGFFYFLMAKVVLPRIADILEVRHDRISQDIDEARRLKEESDAAIAAYEHELAQARDKAHKIAAESSDKARAESEAERSKVEAALNERLGEAEKSINAIRNAAMAEVDTIASDTTKAIVAELIGGSVTKAEITKAVTAAGK